MVLDKGGVHVIQTFFSVEKAEEVQIKGRTARQGKKGSYSVVLLKEEVEETFGIKFDSETMNNSKFYDTIDAAGNRVHGKKWEDTEDAKRDAQQIDKKTREYFDKLLQVSTSNRNFSSHAQSLCRTLYRELRGEENMMPTRYHLIFIVDKSGSTLEGDQKPTSGRFPQNRFGCALEACDRFVRQRDGAEDLVSLIMFDHQVELEFQGRELHDELITELMDTKQWGHGGTNFHPAFEQALQTIRSVSSHEPANSNLPVHVMFLTDGEDGVNRDLALKSIEEIEKHKNVSMRATGFGIGADVGRLKELMDKMGTRGKVLDPVSADELVATWEEAAAELSNEGNS
jgi:Mg-chelatase subunit ChlD